MTTIRKATGYITYLSALLIAGLFSIMGRSAPSWAEDAQANYNSHIFNERFRVAQNSTTTTTNPTLNNPKAVFPANTRAVYPDSPRAVFPDNPRAVFPDSPRAVFPDNPGLERLINERAVFPDSPLTNNVEIENKDFTDAIDAVNLKIRDRVELNAVDRAFIRSIEMNRELIDQNKLLINGK